MPSWTTRNNEAADVIDLVKTFQQILDRARTRPVLDVNEETVTVGQMIDYLRRRLALEDRPVRLKQMLMTIPSQQALVCMFLAMLEMVRLQAVQLRQDRLFFFAYFEANPQPSTRQNSNTMLQHEALTGTYRFIDKNGVTRTLNVLDVARAAGHRTAIDPTIKGILDQITATEAYANSFQGGFTMGADIFNIHRWLGSWHHHYVGAKT